MSKNKLTIVAGAIITKTLVVTMFPIAKFIMFLVWFSVGLSISALIIYSKYK